MMLFCVELTPEPNDLAARPLNKYSSVSQTIFELKQGICFPSLATFTAPDNKKLHYLAARHAVGVTHPTCRMLRDAIDAHHPDCLILEGFDNRPETIASVHTEDLDPERCGEPGYGVHLARQHFPVIPFVGGEPTDADIQNALPKPYDSYDFCYYNFIQSIDESFREDKKYDSIGAYSIQRFGRNYMEWFESWFKDRFNGRTPILSELQNTEFTSPLEHGNFVQQLGYHINKIRNYEILEKIRQCLQRYNNVLVVYGASHYFEQYPVLQARYGKPTYQFQSLFQRCMNHARVILKHVPFLRRIRTFFKSLLRFMPQRQFIQFKPHS